jgi:hypothetical protein
MVLIVWLVLRGNESNLDGKAIQKGLSRQGKIDAALPSPTDQPLPCFFTGLRRHIEDSLVLAFGQGRFICIATPFGRRYLLTIIRRYSQWQPYSCLRSARVDGILSHRRYR